MGKYLHSLLFILLLAAVSIVNLDRMNSGPAVLDRESRRVNDWPEWNLADVADGKWARRAEDAFADRFLLREGALAAAARFERLKGLPSQEAVLLADSSADLYGGSPEEIPAAPAFSAAVPEPEEAPAPSTAPGPEESRPVESAPVSSVFAASAAEAETPPSAELWTSKVLIYENRGYETAWYTDYAASYYTRAVENLAGRIDEGIGVYVMIIPSAIEFLQNEKYRSLSYPQAKGIRDIYAKFSSRVTALDVLPELGRHGGEYLYHKTDHHWTGLGAWYAYAAAARAVGIRPFPYEAYPKESIPGFLGTMYNRTRSAELFSNPDTVELVYPFANHVFTMRAGPLPVEGKAVDKSYIQGFNTYLAYINGDYPHADIRGPVKNGRRILVLKDSYANAFIPYLIPHFEEVHIIDPRYWSGSVPAYVRENDVTDVLIFNYYLVVSVYVGFADNIFRVTGN